MKAKAKTYEEAAIECAKELKAEDIEYLRLYICYDYHHFGYGMYLRNTYDYLLKDNFCDFRDDLSEKIYYLIIMTIFPEYKEHEKFIDIITDMLFSELNANYNLKFNRNFVIDITPENYIVSCDSPVREVNFGKWFNQIKREKKAYAVEIAEHIWQFCYFRDTALNLGYSEDEIEEIYTTCLELLTEKDFFVPLEILYAKNSTEKSINEMIKSRKMIEWLFSEQESNLELLPSYFTENKKVRELFSSP